MNFFPPSNQTGHWVVIAKPKGREIQALKVTQNMAVYQELSCTVKVRRGIYTLNLRYIILEIPLPIWNISEIFQVRSLFRGGWSIPIIHCFKITLLICPCWPRDRLHTFRDLETFTAVFTLDAWDCDQSINYLLWCAERGLVCMNCQASPTVHIPDLQKHVTRQRRAGNGNSTANTYSDGRRQLASSHDGSRQQGQLWRTRLGCPIRRRREEDKSSLMNVPWILD